MAYSIKEVLSLETMLASNFTSKASAVTINIINKIINKNLSENMNEVSLSTTRRSISKFYNEGFIERGINNGRYKTYFINQKGREFLIECIGEE